MTNVTYIVFLVNPTCFRLLTEISLKYKRTILSDYQIFFLYIFHSFLPRNMILGSCKKKKAIIYFIEEIFPEIDFIDRLIFVFAFFFVAFVNRKQIKLEF